MSKKIKREEEVSVIFKNHRMVVNEEGEIHLSVAHILYEITDLLSFEDTMAVIDLAIDKKFNS